MQNSNGDLLVDDFDDEEEEDDVGSYVEVCTEVRLTGDEGRVGFAVSGGTDANDTSPAVINNIVRGQLGYEI